MVDKNYLLKIPLSNIQTKHELGKNCRIIEYSNLGDYNCIEQLLSKQKDYVIILIETTAQNVGHLTCFLDMGIL